MKRYIPALDGIRGIAIAMVMAVHFFYGFQPTNGLEKFVTSVAGYGNLGVDLFFALSGFLITGILLESKRDDSHYFRNFFMRRLLRIFPLYYGVLALIFLGLRWVPALQGETMDEMVSSQWWAWGYGVNFLVASKGAWTPPYISHFWSLAVEEHFYLIWPLFVYFLDRRNLLKACWIAIVASTGLSVLLELQGVNYLTIYTLTPCRLNGLCLGGLMATLTHRRELPPSSWAVWIIAAGLLSKLAIVLVARAQPSFNGVLEPFRGLSWLTIFVGLILAAVSSAPNSLLVRCLSSRSLVFLGKYSYGLYVYHHFISSGSHSLGALAWLAERMPHHTIAVLVHGALGVALSIAIAMLSFHAYEKHFLKLKDRFSPKKVPSPIALSA
jgi:peptidoglycan/LPS O-acetylase OafA/YrhL